MDFNLPTFSHECEHCGKSVENEHHFCPQCGFNQKLSHNKIIKEVSNVLKTEYNNLQREINNTSGWRFSNIDSRDKLDLLIREIKLNFLTMKNVIVNEV